MHAITFEWKKAHLGAVAYGRKVVAEIEGMTPARFDLLYAVYSTWRGLIGCRLRGYSTAWQADLRRLLGLHPSTVSKLISRLVRLGWLQESRDSYRRVVWLTDAGRRAITAALRIIFGGRTHGRFAEKFFATYAYGKKKRAVRGIVAGMIYRHVLAMRRAGRDLGRTAELEYWPYDSDH